MPLFRRDILHLSSTASLSSPLYNPARWPKLISIDPGAPVAPTLGARVLPSLRCIRFSRHRYSSVQSSFNAVGSSLTATKWSRPLAGTMNQHLCSVCDDWIRLSLDVFLAGLDGGNAVVDITILMRTVETAQVWDDILTLYVELVEVWRSELSRMVRALVHSKGISSTQVGWLSIWNTIRLFLTFVSW